MKLKDLSISDQVALIEIAVKTSDRIWENHPDREQYINEIIAIAEKYAEKIIKPIP